MSKDLIFEIGTEEIPANFIPPALDEIMEKGRQSFENQRIAFDKIQAWGTPRRLVLSIIGLSETQAESSSEVIGPPKAVAYDATGQPTAAAIGFAKAQSVALSALQIRKTDRGEYLCAVKRAPRQATSKLLKILLPQLISSLTFPKTMRWNAEGIRFVRPIRWIVVLYGDLVIPFRYAGVASGRLSYARRALGKKPVAVKNASSYQKQLKDHGVVVSVDDRRAGVTTQLERLARQMSGVLPRDEELLEQTVFMVEEPVTLCGNFDPVFLRLPKEVLISAMREHQGYFHLRDRKDQLLPHFLCVVDGKAAGRVVQTGHERVLRARLSDARFFFEADQKRKLVDLVDELKKVTFQESLGTLYDKTERLMALSAYLALELDPALKEIVHRAAYLSKADLLTGMVGEFPKLQGIMGREYARIQGEPGAVAVAIGEQYLPRFAGDELPAGMAGKILSLADKMDTIAGCFGVGLVPTGSEDPYGLRRQAFGILQILVQGKHRLSLTVFVNEAIKHLKNRIKKDPAQLQRELRDFLQQRLESHLLSEVLRYDLIGAVLARRADDPYDVTLRANALARFRSQPGFKPLVLAAKRLSNILKETGAGEVHPEFFKESAENELYDSLTKTQPLVEAKIREQQYDDVLRLLTKLHEPIQLFFEKVLVMAPEDQIRQNRLALLQQVR
ncbi:MAG TPA: glycine--tRNA ligase subunit beta, partial [Nitrospiria bacterium]|nr:glycine--tRNA ligase subunit beta [Nitrospiria bacterium]